MSNNLLRSASIPILKSMVQFSDEALWNLNEAEFLALLNTDAFKPLNREIRFYAPSFTYYKTPHFCSTTNQFPTISITGNTCALNCKHCGGKVLQTMHSALSPTKLFDLGVKLKRNGAQGCLVSGGCLPDGSVPLEEFALVLGRFKHELGLTVFVHTGITRKVGAEALKAAGVDAALIDVVGSTETIRRVYNLDVAVGDYADSLHALADAGLSVVPHVIVGLNGGKLDGEYEALKIIRTIQPSALVIIAFMPIAGTAMAQTTPPKPIDIAKVTALARQMFPQTPLTLGCMRPKGAVRGETDVLALKAGADAIAFPSEAALEYAKNRGYRTVFSSYCCAQLFLDACKGLHQSL